MNIKMKGILLTVLMTVILAFSGTMVEAADAVKPTVVISGGAKGEIIKEGGTVVYYLNASDNVGVVSFNLTAAHVELHNFTANISITGDGVSTKTITLSNIKSTNSEKKYVSIKAGVAVDTSGNESVAISSSAAFSMETVDLLSPSITISSPSSKTVESGGSVSFTIKAKDNVGVENFYLNSDYIEMKGFTATMSVSGNTVTFSNVKANSTSDVKYIVVKAGIAVDAAGNKSSEFSSSAFTISEAKDILKPSITVSSPSPKTVESGGSVTYKITAKDNVKVDKLLINSDYIEMKGFTATMTVDGNNVTFSNVKSNSTSSAKYIVVKAGIATDTSGNKSDEVYSSSFTITEPKDVLKPSITVSSPSPKTINEGGSVTYKITAKDNVGVEHLYLNSDYIEMKGFTATMTVDGNNVTFSNVKSDATSSAKYIVVKKGIAVDAVGNVSDEVYSSPFTINVEEKDTIAPVVSIGNASPSSIYNNGTVTYVLTFSDDKAVTEVNLTANNIKLNGFTADISVTGSGLKTRTVTLTNIKGNVGTDYTITVASGVIKDAAGNVNVAVTSPKFSIMKPVETDTIAPVVSIGNASASGVYRDGTITYVLTFSDNKAVTEVNLTANNIKLNGFTADISVTGSGLKTRTVTLTKIKGNVGAECTITVDNGVIRDAAGNVNVAVTSPKFTILKTVVKDTIAPVVSIGNASPSGVYNGGKVTYIVTFSDNVAVTEVNLTAKNIKLNGFTADISVTGSGLKTRTVTLTNIKGSVASGYSITIDKGVAKDAAGNINVATSSPKFSILKSPTTPSTPSTPSTPTSPTAPSVDTVIKADCIDDLSMLGDINEEITYFSSWLRAEKYTASYVQENNYVAEDERMTYMVEYYNGSTAPSPDVKFTLTIPYKVDVEEINGNGYVKSKTDKETVIAWDMGKISSGAYCRLYVRVKFYEDTDLVNSTNISKVFCATLKTTAGGNTSYSYMRQLFIDKTPGKTGTYKGYLSAIDSSNSIRPEDKITRAEFAKLLADCGIVTADANSTAYKQYKDWESIPVYARAAVAALSDTDIIQAFPDGSFKPNNPILMEDALQMIAQASTYISGTKLTVIKPTFLYKSVLKDSYGDLTDKKDYIMELMRQNVIVKYESKPDEYALRKDVVEMVNALTFRGPYVEKLPENAIKFADIKDDSVYFYNIVGAANSYSYSYDYRLWQEIVEIQ